jgi:hypothetical protein
VGLVVTSVLLGPALGGYGVAIGDVVGGLAGVAVVGTVAGLAGEPPEVSWRRVFLLLIITAACWALGSPIADLTGSWAPWVKTLSVAVYPVLLIWAGVIPIRHLTAVWVIVSQTLFPRNRPEAMIDKIATLPSLERRTLLTITRDGEPASRVTALTGVSELTVWLALVSALRHVADAGVPGPHDQAIADYLLIPRSATQRDGIARELWEAGVSAVELHLIETAYAALRSAPAKAWSATVLRGRTLPPGPWPIDPTALELLDEVVRAGKPRRQVATRLGLDRREADRELIGALRALTNDGGAQPVDGLIASFLLDGPDAPPARQLWAAGVDPLELHQLELALTEIRTMPKEHWTDVTVSKPAPAAKPATAASEHEVGTGRVPMVPGPPVARSEPARAG